MPCGRSTPRPKHSVEAAGPPDGAEPHGPSGRIRLRVPAARAFGALPPLTASGLAERFGFSQAAIDGLCSALDTTIGAMVDAVDAPEDVLAVDFTVRPNQLVVQLASPAQRLSPAAWQAVGRRVAGWVTSFEPTDVGARLSIDGTGHDPR